MIKPPRTKVNLSLSVDTVRKVKAIGAFNHQADSHVVDMLVERAWKEMFGEKAVPVLSPIDDPEPAEEEA